MSVPNPEVVAEDMGGWVRVYAKCGAPTPGLAMALSHALQAWRSQNFHLRIQSVAAINLGSDLELHGWYTPLKFPQTTSLRYAYDVVYDGSGTITTTMYDENGNVIDKHEADSPDDDEPDTPHLVEPQ